MDLSKFKDNEIIDIYSKTIKELKNRGIIRTKNVLGEIGEYLAIEHYNKTPGLPNLQKAPIGTENIDAISRQGQRYSIKSTSSNTTGVFYGLEPKDSLIKDTQKFEFIIICCFDDDVKLTSIYEITWDQFLVLKHWHSRMKAWNLVVTKDFVAKAKKIL